MATSALWWLSLNILSIAILAFFSMAEMACVSLNKVRLQYYVSKGVRRAIWLNFLMQHSTYLFGTTLIGVNLALMAGSEMSRQFHSAIGVSPDLAPLTQVIVVVIFGELAPMFAARRYAEHVALLSAPLLYVFGKLLTPILIVLSWIAKLANRFFSSGEATGSIFPTQEELQKILEEQEEELNSISKPSDFNLMVSRIFSLRGKDANQLKEPINNVPLFPSNSTVSHVRDILKRELFSFFLIYHRTPTNIVGIAFPRDLIRAGDQRRAREFCRAPWFVTQNTSAIQILKQFKRNNQTVAIILDTKGLAVGIVTLDDIVEEIFGKIEYKKGKIEEVVKVLVVDRILPGQMTIREFKEQFNLEFDAGESETLSDLMISWLHHLPEVGESIFISPYELTAKDTSLTEVKEVIVKTKI